MAGVHTGHEEIEEYYMVVSQTFRTDEEGYEFYNRYAEHKGFGIRRDNKEKKEDTGILFRRRFVCCKRGYRSKKNFEKPNPKRTPRPLSRCGCNAYLQIELNMRTGEWFVKNFDDKHNHPFTKPDQTPFLWSHRGMSDTQKADAVEFAVGGLRTHQIMEVMEKNHDGYDKVGFVSRDLYNFMAEEKKEMIDGLDAQYMLNYMAAAKEKDPAFFFRYSIDSEGHLQNIFWADPQSRLDFRAFGGVVVFDSTYRSNKYKLPFIPFIGLNQHRSTIVFAVGMVSDETVQSYEWLLRAFLEAMHQEHPRSVIIHGDASMAKAISRIWPNTDHRLCSWHIEENMVHHLRKKKLADFRKFVYQVTEVDEFESLWVAFKKKHIVGKKDIWITRMYELREKWSAAYTKGRYFLGMRSNQRSESLNSRLHVHLNSSMKLVDLIQHYEHCVSILRRKEAALDAVASQTVPFTRLTAEPLEISASYIYTPVIFRQVKEEIVGLSSWEVAELAEENGLITYAVARKLCAHRRFDVRCAFAGSLLDSVNCQCRKMESEDIPCRHIFTVLKYVGLKTIPACCVKERWTMKAKLAFDSARHANTRVWSERMDNYHELRNKASVTLFKASRSPEQIQRVNEFLNSIMDFQPEDDEDDGNNETSTFGPLPAYFSRAKQTWKNKVLDPKPIVPKGKPKGKKSDKRFKPFHENFKGKKKARKASETRKQK